MKLKSKLAIGLALVAGITFAGVVPANAVTQNGSHGCGSGTRVVYLDTDTTGRTVVNWQNRSTGASKSSVHANGGLNRSWGYQSANWVLNASSIKSSTYGCG